MVWPKQRHFTPRRLGITLNHGGEYITGFFLLKESIVLAKKAYKSTKKLLLPRPSVLNCHIRFFFASFVFVVWGFLSVGWGFFVGSLRFFVDSLRVFVASLRVFVASLRSFVDSLRVFFANFVGCLRFFCRPNFLEK